MSNTDVYHNPRCSKSRELVKLLENRNIDFNTILYMEQGLDAEQLSALLRKLGMSARALLRTTESSYKEMNLSNAELSQDALIAAMVAEPKLMQRPIVVHGDRAVVARPAEAALDLF